VLTRGLGLILVVSMGVGCATVPPAPQPGVKHNYEQARDRADELLHEYSGRAREQTALTNALYVWLSAIGATIIGLGVTGTTGVPITGLALGAAFSYGLGTWFTKPEHLAIYKAGADAIRCIRDKSRPLGSAEMYAKQLESAIAPNGPLEVALRSLGP